MYLIDTNVISEIRKKGKANHGVKAFFKTAIAQNADLFISVITVGELFLSPMGLSLISKLSPPRITALMMGGWFLATSFGNKLSGVISGLWDMIPNKSHFFLINFGGAMLAALAIFLMLRWLRRVVIEHTGDH